MCIKLTFRALALRQSDSCVRRHHLPFPYVHLSKLEFIS